MKAKRKKIVKAFNEALKPKPFYAVDEWVEGDDGIVLSSRTSGIPGPLRLALTPYLREPLRQFSNSNTRKIDLCFGTQAGKTTFIFCLLGYIIDYDPGPTMLVYPTMDMARGVSKDRIQPLIQDCPNLRRHMTGAVDDMQLLAYTFDRLTVRFAWSNSESATRSHPIKYLLKDELSAFAPGASAAADERVKTFWNHKIVATSTPMHEDDSMWREIGLEPREDTAKGEDLFNTSAWVAKHATSVFFFHVPCPHCGHKIRLEFNGLRWEKDCAIRDLDEKGWYECQLCHGKITDADKTKAMKDGEWRSENPGGKWLAYHLNSLYAPWETCHFGAIARKYLVAKSHQDPEEMQRFVNNYLALPYSLEQAGIELVTDASIDNSLGAYQRNTLPVGVKALILGGDVHENNAYDIIVGFGANSEAWIISWGINANEQALPEVAKRQLSHPSGVMMRVIAGGIDARFKGQSVFDVCRRYRVLKPVQGQDVIREPGKTTPIPFKTWTPDRDIKGRVRSNALTGLSINTYYFKQIIYQRLNPPEGQPRLLHLPSDSDEMLTRHLQSEQEVLHRRRGAAGYEKKWVKRTGFDDNHLLDCLVYAFAIAYAVKVFRLPEDGPLYGVSKPQAGQGTPVEGQPAQQEKPKPPKKKTYFPLIKGYLSKDKGDR